MPTFSGKVQNNQIILFSAISISDDPNPAHRPYQALLDTGAQRTLVSEKVAREVRLTPIGDCRIIPASGESILTNEYRVRIDIPIGSEIRLPGGKKKPHVVYMGRDIEVAELPYQPENYDVLLGLNFIRGFHLTLYLDQFILSN
jgi:hypothetical protein